MNADVLIDLAEADLNTLWLAPLRPLHGHLRLASGVLTLSDLDARTAQGRLGGQVQLDGRSSQALWTADLRWDGVQLERAIHQKRANEAPPFVSGRLHGGTGLDVPGVGVVVVAQPFKQRAAHLLRLRTQLAGLARLHDPLIELANVRRIIGAPGRNSLCNHCQVTARQAQV